MRLKSWESKFIKLERRAEIVVKDYLKDLKTVKQYKDTDHTIQIQITL